MKKIVIVLPAYNAAKTLEKTVRDIPPGDYELILVDDCSKDSTVEIAKTLGIKTIAHPRNKGYGANQKTCYNNALKNGADIVLMLHPDYQYDPKMIPKLLEPLLKKDCDAVFGSRMLGGKFLEGGMPKWKFYGNVFLTAIENIVLNTYLTECHSGFRAYSRRYLESVNFNANSDDFVFDTEIIVQGVDRKLKILEIPIETRYFDDASQIGFFKSIQYGISIIFTLLSYKLYSWGIINDNRFT